MARIFLFAVLAAAAAAALLGQDHKVVWSAQEQPIIDQMHELRSLPDDERAIATKRLAIQIRQLPAGLHQVGFANSLANLATEGDPGAETLQEVANTLAEALREVKPPASSPSSSGAAGGQDPAASYYATLAQLVRYEHVQISCCKMDDPRFAAAMAKLEADDEARRHADFTLSDLNGKQWTLRELRGSVVLVNFWATWCPPCRKEMPDLETLSRRFGPKGLVVLAISDEEAGKVQPFIAEHRFSFPILLDPGRKVNELFRVEGIPKSFIYDREGKLAGVANDMRTQRQFLEMLGNAGVD